MSSKQLRDCSLDELAELMGGASAGGGPDQKVKAEFLKRQTSARIETAIATKIYTKYMLWSVLVLAVSSLLGLAIQATK